MTPNHILLRLLCRPLSMNDTTTVVYNRWNRASDCSLADICTITCVHGDVLIVNRHLSCGAEAELSNPKLTQHDVISRGVCRAHEWEAADLGLSLYVWDVVLDVVLWGGRCRSMPTNLSTITLYWQGCHCPECSFSDTAFCIDEQTGCSKHPTVLQCYSSFKYFLPQLQPTAGVYLKH